MLETRHIDAFLHLAAAGDVQRVAQQLGISNETLLSMLHDLETSLDTQLFRRERHNQMLLTAAGRVLQVEASATMAALRRAEEQTRRMPRIVDRSLVIALNGSAGHPLVAEVVDRFSREASEFDMILQAKPLHIQRLALLSGEADACFMYTDLEIRLDTRLSVLRPSVVPASSFVRCGAAHNWSTKPLCTALTKLRPQSSGFGRRCWPCVPRIVALPDLRQDEVTSMQRHRRPRLGPERGEACGSKERPRGV